VLQLLTYLTVKIDPLLPAYSSNLTGGARTNEIPLKSNRDIGNTDLCT